MIQRLIITFVLASAEMRERLAQESDASRQLALRKELEAKSYQDRIDKLVSAEEFQHVEPAH